MNRFIKLVLKKKSYFKCHDKEILKEFICIKKIKNQKIKIGGNDFNLQENVSIYEKQMI